MQFTQEFFRFLKIKIMFSDLEHYTYTGFGAISTTIRHLK